MTTEMEEWKEIEDFPGYSISTLGRVRYDRFDRILKAHINNGYPRVFLRKGSRASPKQVHRLVAIAFVEGRSEKKYWVNHKDGDKRNPVASNLEWVAPIENIDHSIKMGLTPPPVRNRRYYPRRHKVGQSNYKSDARHGNQR